MSKIGANIRHNFPWVKKPFLPEPMKQMQPIRDLLETLNCDGTITLEHDMWGSPDIIIRAYIRVMPDTELEWIEQRLLVERIIKNYVNLLFPQPTYFVGVTVRRPTSMITRELGPRIAAMQALIAAKPRLWEGT